MKEIVLKSTLRQYRLDELSDGEQILIRKAIEATDNAYVPYSHFHVGAALLLADGTVFIGANQENAAFPVTLCAERSAIFAAQSQCPSQPITALAIAARNKDGLLHDPITPCGSCRQVILEMEQRYGQPVKIYLYGTYGIYVINSVKDILPLSFVDDGKL